MGRGLGELSLRLSNPPCFRPKSFSDHPFFAVLPSFPLRPSVHATSGLEKFERIRAKLRAYPDGLVNEEIHEQAAKFFNLCRSKGMQGSHTDFMICAYTVANKMKILTKDQDFRHYARVIPIEVIDEESDR